LIGCIQMLKCVYQLELFQTEWNNISLTDIAQKLDLNPDDVAAHHFYNEFYIQLKDNNYVIDSDWKIKKEQMTLLLKQKIDELSKYKRIKVLSIGAGLGLIELPLIIDGYDIELQECQAESFEYIKSQISIKEWITNDFSDLPADSYDLIYMSIVSYVFDLPTYKEVLKNCSRILKKGGKLIIWDPRCPNPIVYKTKTFIKHLLNFPRGVKWGWARSCSLHTALAEKAGFTEFGQCYRDENLKLIKAITIFCFVLSIKKAIYQEIVLEKSIE